MAALKQKTVRFARVVERSGQPQVYTLWLPPEKDPEFKRARAATRVMTIERGEGKAEVGVVGADVRGGGQYLIFPKSLSAFAGARVVGIKFELVEQEPLVPASGGGRGRRRRGASERRERRRGTTRSRRTVGRRGR